jgi:BASS family bile acid:Na+ symporter
MELGALLNAGLPLALLLIMLGMGMTLDVADFVRVGSQGRGFVIGFTAQMLLPPLIAVGLVFAFTLPPEFAVGLLILSFCPSGTTSNLFSYLAGADLALSISLTAVASLITPFSVPLLTEVVLGWQMGAQQAVPFPVVEAIMKLAAVVLLPVAGGMLWRARKPDSCRRWQPRLHRLSVVLFACVIAGIVIEQSEKLVDNLASAGTVSLVLVLAAMLSGWQVARLGGLSRQQTRTISIEVGMQHGGMALVVTQGILHNPAMSVVPLTYGLLMLLPVIALVIGARRDSQEESVA